MPDDLIRRFEDGTLPASEFHHRDHVRLAWLYLDEEPPLAALARFAEGLKRFATRNGVPGLYHETIIWAYLLLIHERKAPGRSRRALGRVRGAQSRSLHLEALRAGRLLLPGDAGVGPGAAGVRDAGPAVKKDLKDTKDPRSFFRRP